jgi:hypothetical protein
MQRKHISWKTKCAAALAALGHIRYDDLKKMTSHQFLTLWQWDHNILHAWEVADSDAYWNLTPMLIKAHREKTRRDAKIIAKSNRLRAREREIPLGIREGARSAYERYQLIRWGIKPKRKIRSRGFDKTRTRGLDGRVKKRRTRNGNRSHSPP